MPSDYNHSNKSNKSVFEKAVLVGLQLPSVSNADFNGSLQELERLVTTLGYQVIGSVTQKRNSEKAANVLGDGKLLELAKWTGGSGHVSALFQHKKHKAQLNWEKNNKMDEDSELDSEMGSETDSEFDSETDSELNSDTEFESELDADNDSESSDNSEFAMKSENEIDTKSAKEIHLELNQRDSVPDSDNNDKNEDKEKDKDIDIEEVETETTENKYLETADIVIVDCDLSPSQIRNLESATDCQVLDRTGVIIEIFSRHARTKAARLQVEIARLSYMAPRLRESQKGGDRQGGGVGGKGAGETSLELDKRRIRDRIKELKTELAGIGNEHQVQRARRSQENTVALVGYTNAGKSSLMRALTGSEILVADKLFATLDTTVRPMYPETKPKILISDTVGFIKKLPHDLVASFKSTLDEALHASLLLYVVDGSDPSFRSQLTVTQKVLSEVGANDVPFLLILNKSDKISISEQDQLKVEFPEAVMISTRNEVDVKSLKEKILSYFEQDMIQEELLVPFHINGILGDLRNNMRVIKEDYNEVGAKLTVRAPEEIIKKFKKKIAEELKPADDED